MSLPPHTGAVGKIGIALALLGAAVLVVTTLDAPNWRSFPTLIVMGGMVMLAYCRLRSHVVDVNRPADEAFEAGYEAGYEKGWRDGDTHGRGSNVTKLRRVSDGLG
jgi:hypothetical protein